MHRRHVDDTERRNRLALRHGLHPDQRLADPVAATRAMTVLHATESATVHLAVHARTTGTSPADVDRSLYDDRALVKQLAMRRTLFVMPVDLLPAALGSASARVAAEQRRLIGRDVERHGVARDGQVWIERATAAVVDLLTGSPPLSARQLREELPELSGTITVDTDKRWGGTFQLAPRVLTLLGAAGVLVRGPNVGHWRTSRPTWTLMDSWLGAAPERVTTEEGYGVLVRRWLRTFGPGTLEDVQWWLGSTRTAARAALAAADAVEVGLDGGGTGWVLPEDVDEVSEAGPWAALLPTLDPTTMGWKQRGFYLDPRHVPSLFDSFGNAGTTAWWQGRVVGCWVQDAQAGVRVVLREGEDVGAQGRAALAAEADRLTAWLDGVQIPTVYTSPLMKESRLS
ncbi:winged helix DNA-binding domain-containing protein [Ornithinimicrobium sp. LYQ103]|uniref:winged helix DNA-binding domain-containing protein n=1 Tax=Ornithinimicrobium sp. LYQ103 TaxID=3378796 RepID=UPI00385291D3